MFRKRRNLKPRLDRGPLRVLFVITSMPVGGAETLLANLIRGLDADRFQPELCCLKQPGPLAEPLSFEIPVHSRIISGKYDRHALHNLRRLIERRRIDAVVTVGAGDKMFWGRLAAWREGVPVILSAVHSTGWPDGIGRLNRWLTPITDGFIAVAESHGRYLIEEERFPQRKVFVIPNGVDVSRFQSLPDSGLAARRELHIPRRSPVCGIVAALRPEKNHLLFVRAAEVAGRQRSDAHFVVIGDGPERDKLEQAARAAKLQDRMHFLGSRADIPQLLSAMNVLALTSHNEANPVCILEAMACELPVVSTHVGSVAEVVRHGQTGYLVPPGDADGLARHWLELFADPEHAQAMGAAAREQVASRWSIQQMVRGYQDLIASIYDRKCPPPAAAVASPRETTSDTDLIAAGCTSGSGETGYP